MAKKICATCGADIDTAKTGYIKCLDNFLQVKYFDSEENNVFCSEECACKSLMIERVFEEEEDISSAQDDFEEELLTMVNKAKVFPIILGRKT